MDRGRGKKVVFLKPRRSKGTASLRLPLNMADDVWKKKQKNKTIDGKYNIWLF